MADHAGFSNYAIRDMLIKSLGFSGYRDYMKSELWASIRSKKIKSNPKCQVCDSAASCVHHARYTRKNLDGRSDDLLVSLCHSCHHRVEFNDDEKEGVYDAFTRLMCLLTLAERFKLAEKLCKKMGRKYKRSWYSGGYEKSKRMVRNRAKCRRI